MKLSLRMHLSLFACLLLVGVGLASCGGTSSATNRVGSMTLSVGQITNDVPFLPYYVALEENYFKAQGLTLNPATPPSLNSGAKLATGVEANGFDVALGTMNDAFTIAKVDSAIRVIGSITNDFLLNVVVTRRFEQENHVTPASPLADKVKALVGKRVGISAPNSSTDALITYLFKQQGLNALKDVTKVSVGANNPVILAALEDGRLDVAVQGTFGSVLGQVQGASDILISPVRGDVPKMQGQLFGVLYAKQSTIDAKPKAVQALIRGIAQAETFIQQHPDQAIPILAKYLKVKPQMAGAIFNAAKHSMPQSPLISQQSYDTADQFQVQAGLLAISLDYNKVIAIDTIKKALNG